MASEARRGLFDALAYRTYCGLETISRKLYGLSDTLREAGERVGGLIEWGANKTGHTIDEVYFRHQRN